MPKKITVARQCRVVPDRGAAVIHFRDALAREILVAIPLNYASQLAADLTKVGSPLHQMAGALNTVEPGSLPPATALEFRAHDNGTFAFVFLAEHGEVEIVVDLVEAERIFGKLAGAIALAKQGRHPTRQ